LNELPVMSIRKLMPKIPGQDTSVFKNWNGRQHDNRKVLAIEADEGDVEMIQYLVETAKNRQLFEKRWGRMAKVTIAIDNRQKKRGGHQTQLQVISTTTPTQGWMGLGVFFTWTSRFRSTRFLIQPSLWVISPYVVYSTST
jgi:hypothetical protein